MANALNATEFKEIKSDAEESIKKLEAKVKELSEKLELDQNVLDILDTALENLKNLAGLYMEGDVEGKQLNFAFRLI